MRARALFVLMALVSGLAGATPPVKAEDQTLVVATNESEWPAFIYVDDEPLCYVSETKGDWCKGIVSPGSHKLEAYVGSDVIASKNITLKRGDTYLWTVRSK